jgi:hypothetical protein
MWRMLLEHLSSDMKYLRGKSCVKSLASHRPRFWEGGETSSEFFGCLRLMFETKLRVGCEWTKMKVREDKQVI